MRALIIVAGAALALTACGNNDQTDNNQNVDENLTAEDIVSNDITAIDAVTGDAANMAADVNYTETENLADNVGNTTRPEPKRPAAKPATGTAPDEPATDTDVSNDAAD